MELVRDEIVAFLKARYDKKTEELTPEVAGGLVRYVVLNTLDDAWRDHLLTNGSQQGARSDVNGRRIRGIKISVRLSERLCPSPVGDGQSGRLFNPVVCLYFLGCCARSNGQDERSDI